MPSSVPRARTRLVVGYTALAVAALVLLLVPAGPVPATAVQLSALLAVAAVLVGTRLGRPERLLPWALVVLGLLLSSGAATWAAPAASPVSGLPVLAQIAFVSALLLARRGAPWTAAAALTGVGAGVAVGLVAWAWAAVGLATSGAGGLGTVLSLRLAGGVLLVSVATALVSAERGHRGPLGPVAAAATLALAADLAAILASPASRLAPVLAALGMLSWGWVALRGSMIGSDDRRRAPTGPLHPRGIAGTAGLLLAPVLALLGQRALGLPVTVAPMGAGAVVLYAVVVARLTLALGGSATADQERERAQHELAHQAAHDSLTGVPNRAQAMRLIHAALSRGRRSGSAVGLLFLDLDGFKAINDSLGHGVGDEVLRCVADRMQANIRSGDVVARLGGDEFIVLLEPVDDDVAAIGAADRLIEIISEPITLADGRQIGVGASVGVSVSQDASIDPEQLLHEADVAVYRAKQTGRGHTEVFDQSLRRELRHRSDVESGVIAAIQNDELVVHYQPIVNVLIGDVLGYEALVRWRRPDGNIVAPAEFILIAEQSDLICDLDSWVLQRATRQLARWNRERGSSTLFIAVNVSGRHIVRQRFCDDVEEALQASGIEPRQLVLEITETALIDDSLALTNLETLRNRGISISIDDFGSGYNSIARLEQLPVDIVKIDSRFLNRGGPSTDKLLRLIVQAAHAFGLPVVAEGVEHEYQLDTLRSIECESAQGFFLGRPVDPAEIDVRSGLTVPAGRPSAAGRATSS